MRPAIIFKTSFCLQLALFPFVVVLYVFFGMAAVASWDSSGSVKDALTTTISVAVLFIGTIAVLVSPGYAARIADAQKKRLIKERIVASLGSAVALFIGGLGTISSFTAGYTISGLLWALFFTFHASVVWYVNSR